MYKMTKMFKTFKYMCMLSKLKNFPIKMKQVHVYINSCTKFSFSTDKLL